jgi:hypothetical protein
MSEPQVTGGYLPAEHAQALRSIFRQFGVSSMDGRRALTELCEAIHAAGSAVAYMRGYADGANDHEDDQTARAMAIGAATLNGRADPLGGPSPLVVTTADGHHQGE